MDSMNRLLDPVTRTAPDLPGGRQPSRLPRAFALTAALAVAAFTVAPAHAQGQGMVQIDPDIQQMLGEVSGENLDRIVRALAGFETRHSLSSMDDPDRGVGAAMDWLVEEWSSYSPRLQVSRECFNPVPVGRITREVEVCNIMAVLPGRTARRVYVSGHHDTVARVAPGMEGQFAENDHPAPGANDNASGTVAAMEVSRILAQSGLEFDATLVFIAFGAEELGLFGARYHAQRAREEGIRIDAVLNNDMLGNIESGDGQINATVLQLFAPPPDDSPARELARYIHRVAGAYVPNHEIRRVAREDRFGRGGDHTPFNNFGFAAIRFTELMENYSRQHTADDLPDDMHIPFFVQNTKVNLAVAASLALAPAAPEVTTPNGQPRLGRGATGYDATLQWDAVPGAVSYRVYMRDGWSMDWQRVLDVGNVTEVSFPGFSIDDSFIGVAAVGPGGHESLVSPYVMVPRNVTEVEVR